MRAVRRSTSACPSGVVRGASGGTSRIGGPFEEPVVPPSRRRPSGSGGVGSFGGEDSRVEIASGSIFGRGGGGRRDGEGGGPDLLGGGPDLFGGGRLDGTGGGRSEPS